MTIVKDKDGNNIELIPSNKKNKYTGISEKVAKIYAKAIADKGFLFSLAEYIPEYTPEDWWTNDMKRIFASIYVGFLIAKDEYNEKDFL